MTELDKKPDDAHRNYEAIKLHTRAIQANMIILGRLFHENHSLEYYKTLGCDTWKEFLAQPDICYKESTVRSLVGIYKKYILELNVNEDRLMNIGHYRLRLISPVVEENPEEWLGKAEHLSLSDLIYEVKALPPKPKKPEPIMISGRMTPKEYMEFVESQPCILHPERGAEKHHFPQTRKRTDALWKMIPLCHDCHMKYHDSPKEFLWANRVKIIGYFWNLIVRNNNQGGM